MKKILFASALTVLLLSLQNVFALDAGSVLGNTSNMSVNAHGNNMNISPGAFNGKVQQIDWAKFNTQGTQSVKFDFTPASQTIIHRQIGESISPDVNKSIISNTAVMNEAVNKIEGSAAQVNWQQFNTQNQPQADISFQGAQQTILNRQLGGAQQGSVGQIDFAKFNVQPQQTVNFEAMPQTQIQSQINAVNNAINIIPQKI